MKIADLQARDALWACRSAVFTSLGPELMSNVSFGSLGKKFGNHCSTVCTTGQTLRQTGYSSRKPHQAPLLSAKNRKPRLQFAQTHQKRVYDRRKNVASSEAFPMNPKRWLWVKIPLIQQFEKYSDKPVWHQQPWHIQSHISRLSSSIGCLGWTAADHVD